jgi:hypothetical protein
MLAAVVKAKAARGSRGTVTPTAASTRPRREKLKSEVKQEPKFSNPGDSVLRQVKVTTSTRVLRPTKSWRPKANEHNDKPNQCIKTSRCSPDIQDVLRNNSTGPGATSSSAMEIVQDSPLLKLPAEIRNEIWRWTVVVPNQLAIYGDNPKQPAITRTCRQIRQESIGYFYRKNSFTCTIRNYDPTNFK